MKENCGICSTSISNRGVLDCCDHLFCFSCIDGWAAITNHCPSCKSVFKLITFLPVEGDDLYQSKSTDIQNEIEEREAMLDFFEEDLPLTFPTYYIDEEAVECLEGGDCLVHCGKKDFDNWDDLSDTSVACDSCDRWYHAICVEFNPGKFEGAWFCPRCSFENFSWRCMSLESNMEAKVLSPIRPSCFGKLIPEAMTINAEEGEGLPMTVEMPELGETAIVVSMVTENMNQEDPSTEEEALVSSRMNLHHHPADFNDAGEVFETTVFHEQVKQGFDEENAVEAKDCHEAQDCKVASSSQTDGCNYSFEPEDQTSCGNDISRRPELDTSCSMPNLQASKEVVSSSISNDCSVKGKRKLEFETPEINSSIMEIVRADGFPNKSQRIAQGLKVIEEPGQIHGQAARQDSGLPNHVIQKHEAAEMVEPCYAATCIKTQISEDINILVAKSEPQALSLKVGAMESSKDLDKEYGVRTRKIMWRANDSMGKKSSLVEEVRQRMRVAAGYGAVAELGLIDISDDKFLSAFKSALAKTSQKAEHTLRCRKSGPLKQGGIREALTKKLYGGGRGKRVWDRDWDISFWTKRASHMRRSAKDTTQRRVSDGSEFDKELASVMSSLKDDREAESLLGRLYVADISLLPRANNIQSVSEKLKGQASDLQKSHNFEGSPMTSPKNRQSSNQSSTRSDPRVTSTKLSCQSHFPKKLMPTQSHHATAKAAISAGTKVVPKVTKKNASTTSTKDKREWALEVLARKKGETAPLNVHGKNGGFSSGKKIFQFLAQLPYDMRPVVEHDSRSRISTAVRQAQLNRLVDYHLKRANLLTIGINEESQAVISEAVLKEQDIYERSNSKIVYINLCVQSLNQMSLTEKLENTVSKVSETDIRDTIDVALLAAGLISDSPPGSPRSTTNLRIGENNNCSQSDQNGCNQDSDQSFHTPPFCEPIDQSLEIYKDIEFEFDACEPSWQVFQERTNSSDTHRSTNPDNARLKIRLSSANDATPASSSSLIEKPLECCAIMSTSDTDVAHDPGVMDKCISTESTNPSTSDSGVNVAHDPSVMEKSISTESTKPSTLDKDIDIAQDPGDMENGISTKSTMESISDKDVDAAQVPGLMETGISTESAVETILTTSSIHSGDLHPKKPDTEFTAFCEEPLCLLNRSSSEVPSTLGKVDQQSKRIICSDEILPVKVVSQSICSSDVNDLNNDNLDEKTFLEVVDRNSPILSSEGNIIEGQVSHLKEIEGHVGDELFQSNTFFSRCEKGPSSQPSSDHKETMPLLQQNAAAKPQQIAGSSDNPLETVQVRNELQLSVQKKVEMYVKEHIRPLCKSGVVTVEQYRWALMKTTRKVLQHHHESTSADFLITEGCKVKKLAEQYLQIFVQRNTAH